MSLSKQSAFPISQPTNLLYALENARLTATVEGLERSISLLEDERNRTIEQNVKLIGLLAR